MSNLQRMDVIWRVSSKSSGGNCIEVGDSEIAILVRDTKNRDQGMLSFPSTAWENFIKVIQTDSISLR